MDDREQATRAAAGSTASAEGNPELVAFYGANGPKVRMATAPRWRTWMNETNERNANRCLPLLVANEAGWVLLNPSEFTATWGGEPGPSSIEIEFADAKGAAPRVAESHFGHGVITFRVPYLFRTPPGWNLLARGPANWPKDGVCALEGLVETDWAVATFTMNWKLTRPNHPVTFEVDEPFCMIVPQRRGELESFRPALRDIHTEPETAAAAEHWVESRHELLVRKFLSEYSLTYADDRNAWQRHYFKGTSPSGVEAPAHQTKLKLADFELD